MEKQKFTDTINSAFDSGVTKVQIANEFGIHPDLVRAWSEGLRLPEKSLRPTIAEGVNKLDATI